MITALEQRLRVGLQDLFVEVVLDASVDLVGAEVVHEEAGHRVGEEVLPRAIGHRRQPSSVERIPDEDRVHVRAMRGHEQQGSLARELSQRVGLAIGHDPLAQIAKLAERGRQVRERVRGLLEVLRLEEHPQADRERLRGQLVNGWVELPRDIVGVRLDETTQDVPLLLLGHFGELLGGLDPPGPGTNLLLGARLGGKARALLEGRVIERVLEARVLVLPSARQVILVNATRHLGDDVGPLLTKPEQRRGVAGRGTDRGEILVHNHHLSAGLLSRERGSTHCRHTSLAISTTLARLSISRSVTTERERSQRLARMPLC